MVVRCELKIPSLGITRQASWCRTLILVTEFSIRTSQPLKILIIPYLCKTTRHAAIKHKTNKLFDRYDNLSYIFDDPIIYLPSLQLVLCLFEIRKIAVCFLWLSLPGHYRVTDEALLAETT